jgi:hypothetical protein
LEKLLVTDFEMNVWEIRGVTNYRPERLPKWFASRCAFEFGELVGRNPTDAELIEDYVRPEFTELSKLRNWGCACVNGGAVAIFEYVGIEDGEWYELAHFAEFLRCGYEVVEPNVWYDGGWTTYFTEKRRYARRTSGMEATLLASRENEAARSPRIN